MHNLQVEKLERRKMVVTIKSRQLVKAGQSTWNGILPLSELDQTGFTAHTPFIFIYNKSSQINKSIVLDSLKHSLSRILVPFYPLAGRLGWADIHMGGRFQLECNDSGAELIEADSTQQVSDFTDFTSIYQAMFHGLLPHVDYINTPLHQLPILFVQLTWFKCGGICIGVSTSHVVADARAIYHFINDFAKLTREVNGSLEALPYLDRRIVQVIADHKLESQVTSLDVDVHDFTRLPILLEEENDLEQRKREIVSQNLILTKEQVDTLKKVANKDNKMIGVRPYTRYEIITAHIWRCATKARGHIGDQMTAVCILVDSRSRFNPPLPPRYFGDAVLIAVEQAQAGELISSPLSHTCQRIKERKEKTGDAHARSSVNHFKAQTPLFKYQERSVFEGPQGVFFGNPNLSVSSLLNTPVRDIDFGWGKEIYVGIAAQQYDGDIVIYPGYVNDGSVVVSVGLQAQHMENFKHFFYQDILLMEQQASSRRLAKY